MRSSDRRTRVLPAAVRALGHRVRGGGTKWKKLTRRDLTKFDDVATKAILTAMERGGIGRVSARGHATIRASESSGTMSISGNTSAPHIVQNIQADLNRLFPEPAPTKDPSMNGDVTPTFTSPADTFELPGATIISENGRTADVTPDEELLPCLAKGCDKEFVTGGARYAHIRDDHATCEWEGPDAEHDDPSYTCNMAPDGTAFVGMGKQSVAGHVNIHHRGNKPWLHRDPSGYKASARKGAETRAAKLAAERAKEAGRQQLVAMAAAAATTPEPQPSLETAPPTKDAPKARNVSAPKADTSTTEHRGLPQGKVTHRPTTPAAQLAAIRAILGDDPKVAKLQAEVDELKAHLDLVREALNLNNIPKK